MYEIKVHNYTISQIIIKFQGENKETQYHLTENDYYEGGIDKDEGQSSFNQ